MIFSLKFIFLLLIISFTTTTYGEGLSYYRSNIAELKKISSKAQGKVDARVLKIRKALGTENINLTFFNETSGPFSKTSPSHRDNRYYSSFVYKSILNSGAEALLVEDRFRKPMPYNPAWTYIEHKKVLEVHRQNICINALIGKYRREGRKDFYAIRQLLNEINFKLVLPEQTRKEKQDREDLSQLMTARSYTDSQRTTAVLQHLIAGPKNSADQGILDILGRPVAIEVVNGYTQRIVFHKKDEMGDIYLPASLTMFANFRSGDDQYFLEIQKCMIDFIRDSLENSKHVDLHGRMRLAQEFIKRKGAEALGAHKMMKAMSQEQINYVLDLFLQLRGSDLLSEEEYSVFGRSILLHEKSVNDNKDLKPKEKKAKIDQIRKDYSYYVGLNRQLEKLEATLQIEKAQKESLQRIEALLNKK